MITIQKFEEILKNVVDKIQTTTEHTKLEQLEYELTDAYLHVQDDTNPILFRVKVTSRYEFVMKLIFNKKWGL